MCTKKHSTRVNVQIRMHNPKRNKEVTFDSPNTFKEDNSWFFVQNNISQKLVGGTFKSLKGKQPQLSDMNSVLDNVTIEIVFLERPSISEKRSFLG